MRVVKALGREDAIDAGRVARFRRATRPVVAAAAFPGAPDEFVLGSGKVAAVVVVAVGPHDELRGGPEDVVYFPIDSRANAEAFARHLRSVARKANTGVERFLVRPFDGQVVVTPLHIRVDAAMAVDPKTRGELQGVAAEFSKGMGGRPVRLEVWNEQLEAALVIDSAVPAVHRPTADDDDPFTRSLRGLPITPPTKRTVSPEIDTTPRRGFRRGFYDVEGD